MNSPASRPYLAGAASAIAFAFHETSHRILDWSLLPVLLAVICWGASFSAGVWANRYLQLAIKANLAMNMAERDGRQEKFDMATTIFNKNRDRTGSFQEAQLWLLLAGAALYLGGHVWHLAEAVPANATPITSHSTARS